MIDLEQQYPSYPVHKTIEDDTVFLEPPGTIYLRYRLTFLQDGNRYGSLIFEKTDDFGFHGKINLSCTPERHLKTVFIHWSNIVAMVG